MKLEIKENIEIQNYEMESEFLLYSDEVLLENVLVKTFFDEFRNIEVTGEYELETSEFEATKKILEFSLEELSIFSKISLYEWYVVEDFIWRIDFDLRDKKNKQANSITFKIVPNFSFWKRTFNFVEYQEKFHEIFDPNSYGLGLDYGNHKYNVWDEIVYYTSGQLGDKPLKIEFGNIKKAFAKTHLEVIKNLREESSSDSILASFNFPEDLKIYCEQYLRYFARFLQDLGINATSNLKEEAGKVLFSVTPTDDVEALDKIREALAVYLNLPSSPIIYDDSFAAMRLQQQVENLQHSQRMAVRELQFNEKLLTAQADMLQEKNVTISQLQSVNEQQTKIIEKLSRKSVMIDSAENKEELEKIYEGIEVGESKFIKEQLGIKFNPAKVVKTIVKNTLGKGDEIISLDLNKEDNE